MNPIRVLLADDHRMMRDGLQLILEQHEELKVIGETGDGRNAVELAHRLRPDVVVMDIGMPGLNGIEATRRIASELPKIKVVALSTHSDKRYVLGILEAGASGYVLKISACEELCRAIRAVVNDQSYLSPQIASIVVDRCVGDAGPERRSAFALLGQREREVLQLLAEGLTSSLIGRRLFISPRTVDAHRRNIMRKLNLHSVAELTKYAVREGLTPLE